MGVNKKFHTYILGHITKISGCKSVTTVGQGLGLG